MQRQRREALRKEQAVLEEKQKARLEEKEKRSKKARGPKALRSLLTASQQPPPGCYFDFYRVGALLTFLFQVQLPPTMAEDGGLNGPSRTVGPYPSRHGACMRRRRRSGPARRLGRGCGDLGVEGTSSASQQPAA